MTRCLAPLLLLICNTAFADFDIDKLRKSSHKTTWEQSGNGFRGVEKNVFGKTHKLYTPKHIRHEFPLSHRGAYYAFGNHCSVLFLSSLAALPETTEPGEERINQLIDRSEDYDDLAAEIREAYTDRDTDQPFRYRGKPVVIDALTFDMYGEHLRGIDHIVCEARLK